MKKAFSMLELVFVLVVAGVIAAVMLPRTQTSPLQEAGVQLISHIRYTQHLAIVDDKYDPNDAQWYKQRWQLVFQTGAATDNKVAYTIFADTTGVHSGDPNEAEIAVDPTSGKLMTGGYSGANALDITNAAFKGTAKMNLGQSYGVTGVTFSNSCSINGSTRISFDSKGRPMKGKLTTLTAAYSAPGDRRLITSDCNITITDGTDNLIITIKPETGYAKIVQYQ